MSEHAYSDAAAGPSPRATPGTEAVDHGFVFAPAPQPSVAVAGADQRFPVRRIFCVGRNYADHAREMGSDPEREPPFFFMKPADAVVDSGAELPWPPLTGNLHHEVELVVAIGATARDIAQEAAESVIYGYAVGVDLTRRDLQNAAKANGRPWEWGKAFDFSAPCGPIRPVSDGGHVRAGAISISVNGVERQRGDVANMIWPTAEVIAAISRSVTLQPGDLIFTGTPAGVAALAPGDRIDAQAADLPPLTFTMAPPQRGAQETTSA